MTEYNLPEWAFLDAHSHLGNPLIDRTVILHIRSASVIEIIDRDNDGYIPVEGVLMYKFKYTSIAGTERLTAILHYSATIDKVDNAEFIKNKILKPCAIWYCNYCAWEDDNIIRDHFDGE